jgi:diguanylate cyclase (GGDEF)-like protein
MSGISQPELAYRAGWARVLFGLIALTLGPLLVPALGKHRLVFALYLTVALALQVLIKRQIGGELRALGGGLVDVAILTFLLHRVGSVSTPLTALYVFLGVMMALVHQRRVAFALAATACVLYTSVLIAEWARLLSYGPDAPSWAPAVAPSIQGVILASLLVWVLVGVSTAIVSQLVAAITRHEQELTRVNRELELLSQRDPLTHLFNRRHILECVELELARVRRGHCAALLMIDLDSFKLVNDQFGHQRGDDVLKQIAEAIAYATRVTDVAGRYGGDEFVVVLPDSDEAQAEGVAKRLVEAVQRAGDAFGATQPVTASVGVAIASGDDDARSLVRRADANAYRAKQLGGNRVVRQPPGEGAESSSEV